MRGDTISFCTDHTSGSGLSVGVTPICFFVEFHSFNGMFGYNLIFKYFYFVVVAK